VNEFDDELFAEAIKVADRAAALYPDRLDFRFMKADAYIAYEKESPDMALAYLLTLVDSDQKREERPWVYETEKVEKTFFADAMQEYCFSFYSIGTPSSLDAFRTLSEKMIGLFPDNVGFMNNIGSYYMIAKKDYKAALKVYSKVLKKSRTDYIAIKNSSLAARQLGNVKLEKKYLVLLAEHGPGEEKAPALHRLKALESKKK
jgi:tetratricopeptide (TPR) repeat protein